jgi:CRISPR-associated exonuclease Cas4
MTGKEVPRGAIYHHSSRRRREVVFDETLRILVKDTVSEVRKMLSMKTIPSPVNDKRCQHCSLLESCMPSVVSERERAKAFGRTLFEIGDP